MAPVGEVVETAPRGSAWLAGAQSTDDAGVTIAPTPDMVPSITWRPAPSAPGISWQPQPNPDAGMQELDWLSKNRHSLQGFAGLWIGILGSRIEASGQSFEEVERDLGAMRLSDALIVRIPEDTRWDYLIA